MDSSKLRLYRQLALDRLEQLLIQLPEEPHEADYFVDRYIRILSSLPSRPDNCPPYEGLYGSGSTLDQYRDVATDRLQELVERLPKLEQVDEEIDNYIRILSDLPERPEGVEPYVRLFVIRPPKPDPENLITVEHAPYAVLAAGWYWNSRQINEAADRDDIREVTRRINGGYNGLKDREKYLKRAKLVLKVES